MKHVEGCVYVVCKHCEYEVEIDLAEMDLEQYGYVKSGERKYRKSKQVVTYSSGVILDV